MKILFQIKAANSKHITSNSVSDIQGTEPFFKQDIGDYFRGNRQNFENIVKENLMQIPIDSETVKIDQMNDKPEKKLMEGYVKSDDIEIEQCDLNHLNNPQFIAQYSKQIFKYLRETEVSTS